MQMCWATFRKKGVNLNRKSVILSSLVVVAVAGIAFAASTNKIEAYAEKLNKADGMSMQFTAQELGGTKSAYSFEAAKPNLARIETPTMLVVSNGKEVTVLMKGLNAYYSEPFSKEAFAPVMDDKNLMIGTPFFDAKALMGLSAKSAGTVTRRGVDLDATKATVDKSSGLTGTFYTDENGMLRQAELNLGKTTTILDVSTITLTRPDASRFEFKAPKGSKQIDKAELSAGKWYTNIAEALTVAKATNKVVLIDFWFEGCVWCERLEANVFSTPEWKEKSKQFVLCKVDIMADPEQAAPYGVQGAPDTRFLNKDGKEVGKIGGYVDLQTYLGHMDAALANR